MFTDFRTHAINIRILLNRFSVQGSHAPEKLQLELNKAQCESVLCSTASRKAYITSMFLYLCLGSLSYVN
jgi:hypothetical protein